LLLAGDERGTHIPLQLSPQLRADRAEQTGLQAGDSGDPYQFQRLAY